MTQRKRATGFALMDTAFAADAKFVRLSRKAKNPTDFAAAVGVYWLILADSRRNRDRIVNWEDYTEYVAEIVALRDAGLLIEEGFAEKCFDRWAPAYKSPWDKQRTDTQGNAEVHEDTQATPTSTLLSSTPLKSVPLNEEADGFIRACELLGYVPNSDEFRNEMGQLDEEFGAEAVVAAVQQAFATSVEEGTRIKPFDLKKAAHMILAESRHRSEKAAAADRRDQLAREIKESVERQAREAWLPCMECGIVGRRHSASGDHEFRVAA